MREIVFDTETTGFDAEGEDRIVEIGALELVNHLPTGNNLHLYINPMRSMPQGAFEVHGLGDEFLADKPRFKDVAQKFLDFIGPDTPLIAHNATFDMRFINAELGRNRLPLIEMSRMIDTLVIAKRKFPGSPASLDALCRRFGVDNGSRTLHGALLDSELLAEVYLELIGGRQPGFELAGHRAEVNQNAADTAMRRRQPRPAPLPPRITALEADAHRAFVAKLGDDAVWRRYDDSKQSPAGRN